MTRHDPDVTARVFAHKRRSRRAKWIARLLLPAASLMMSAALWSDPDIAKHLQRGLQTFSDLASGSERAQGAPDSVNVTPFSDTASTRRLPTVTTLTGTSGAKRITVTTR